MKINKKYIILRLITLPLKLIFDLLWFNLFVILKTFQWLIYGSDEIIFGKDFNRNSVSELIKTVEKLQKNQE